MRAVGRDPLFIASAEGAEIVDVDGNRYLDYVCSWGPLILGHAHPAVVEAVTRRGAARNELRRAHRGGGRAGGRGRRPRAVRRDGAAHLVGHRGVDDRGAPCPRGHRPREGDQVRRRLPRPRRRAAGGVRLRSCDAGHPRLARRDRGAGRRHDRRAVERPRRAQRRPRGPATTWPRSSRSRFPANMGLVPPEPGFLELLRSTLRRGRRAADPRRGDHRLSRRARRGAGAARRAPGPDGPRQGAGRRPAARRGRGSAGAARATGAGGRDLPGRHAVGQPARDRGRARDAAPARRRCLRAAGPGHRAPRGRPASRQPPPRGCRCRCRARPAS